MMIQNYSKKKLQIPTNDEGLAQKRDKNSNIKQRRRNQNLESIPTILTSAESTPETHTINNGSETINNETSLKSASSLAVSPLVFIRKSKCNLSNSDSNTHDSATVNESTYDDDDEIDFYDEQTYSSSFSTPSIKTVNDSKISNQFYSTGILVNTAKNNKTKKSPNNVKYKLNDDKKQAFYLNCNYEYEDDDFVDDDDDDDDDEENEDTESGEPESCGLNNQNNSSNDNYKICKKNKNKSITPLSSKSSESANTIKSKSINQIKYKNVIAFFKLFLFYISSKDLFDFSKWD